MILSILFISVYYFYGSTLIDLFKEEDLISLAKLLNCDVEPILKERLYLVGISGFLFFLVSNKLKILVVIILYFLYKRRYFKLKKVKKELMSSIHYAFPIWIRTIQCLLQNNTMVSAIKVSLDKAPKILKPELQALVERLEHHPEDLQSYDQFMQSYESLEIKKMMKQLYRYSRSSSKDSAESMYRMVDYTSIWTGEVRRKKYEAVVGGYSWMGIIPVASVSVFFVLIMFYVMLQMFERGWGI